jgi:LuxR family transcriptional regulator, maltose regulon positive regulatory protein
MTAILAVMAADDVDAASTAELPLIEAKLAQPRIRAGVIPRARLFGALDGLGGVELTVVSGPAGSGKTVLVSSWLAGHPDLAPAWVTLDPRDDDPLRLWTYVAHAVDRVRPGLGRPALARLHMPRPAVEAAIDELLNGLAGYDGRVVVVLDDLHHVSGESCLRSLAYAVERLPPPARMVATTRSDPGRRLSRLRARGTLGELRAKDIAFTSEEAHRLLVEQAGIPVGMEDVELLVDRTEGWPAGVSLAALWLAGVDAPAEGIRQFSADHHHVADYLTTEVLDVVDEETRSFLLRTSILDRFTPKLCDAVLGTENAARILAEIERSNLFLVALDARGAWYRYHHLFGELLRMELAGKPVDVPELHRRASGWFLANALPEEALEHAAAVGHEELASLLLAEHRTLVRSGKIDVFMDSLELLSDEELERFPVLAAAGSTAAGAAGRPASTRRRLAGIAEANRHRLPEAQRQYVEALVELTRSFLLDTDLDVALGHATRAVELARRHADDLVVPALAATALARYLKGDTAAARAAAREVVEREDAPQRPHGHVMAQAVLALLQSDVGHPHAGESEARRAVTQARELGLAGVWSAGMAHHALGQALLALDRAHEAERELERAEILSRAAEPRLEHIFSLLVLAQARIARGRLTLAASELETAREQLDAFTDSGRLGALAGEVGRLLGDAQAGSEKTVEPPSPAELAVLRLLATDLTQREIGSELYVSMNTVKTHTRNLYGKLGVTSREAAVREANALGLIGDTSSPG